MTDLSGYRMLSVRQPWADFLTADDLMIKAFTAQHPALKILPKSVENRDFGTDWRGTLLIHASKPMSREGMSMFGLDPDGFVYGAVVGTVRLTAVTRDASLLWAQADRKRQWLVANPVRLTAPVHCPGHQGLREPEPWVVAAVLDRLPTPVWAGVRSDKGCPA